MMTQQVQNLFELLNSLPLPQQTEIAEILLEETKYRISLPPPKNKAVVDKMIERVREEIKAGTTMTLEEFLEKAEQYNKEHK